MHAHREDTAHCQCVMLYVHVAVPAGGHSGAADGHTSRSRGTHVKYEKWHSYCHCGYTVAPMCAVNSLAV